MNNTYNLTNFVLAPMMLCMLALPIINMLIKWKPTMTSNEKMTAFECGFDPLSKSRNPISMRFFVLIVLFLIFDIEIMLLFPILMKFINFSCTKLMLLNFMLFIIILFFGLIYEWVDGSLDWIKQ